VPAGARWGGSPAKPIKQFFRELFEVERLGREGSAGEIEAVRFGRRGTEIMDEKAPITIEAVDIGQILKTLPHRYPMLLIDRVIDIRSDFSGIGIKNVSANEPQFRDTFRTGRFIPAC
jgi:hypothetical protein